MSAIENINRGIFFEDTKSMLKWNSQLKEVQTVDNAEINENGTLIKWANKICFDGKPINALIHIDNYHNTSGRLNSIHFEFINKKPFEAYYELFEYFREKLGEPISQTVDSYDYPSCQWNTGSNIKIIIGVAEKFTEYLIFFIKYEEESVKN